MQATEKPTLQVEPGRVGHRKPRPQVSPGQGRYMTRLVGPLRPSVSSDPAGGRTTERCVGDDRSQPRTSLVLTELVASSVALDGGLPNVVPLGVYALRWWDQPAWWTRRAINMFVSDVNIQPNRTGLPGIASLESIVGALLTFGLIAAVAGIAISAIAWAIGSHSGNPHVAGKGKSGVLVALAAAFLIGGATFLVNFFNAQGGHLA